jgi:3-hydroxybutyrate dehydrogenase
MMPLIRRAGGRIIFLSSALAKLPSPVRGMQCAAQAAVEGLAICLRQEVRSRRVNVSIVAAGEFTAGTAWLSEAGMLDQAKKMWEQMSDEQKHTYGEDYFETAVRSMEKFTKSVNYSKRTNLNFSI